MTQEIKIDQGSDNVGCLLFVVLLWFAYIGGCRMVEGLVKAELRRQATEAVVPE